MAIEDIRVGNTVIATAEDSFEVAEKKVVETYIRETRELVHLTINSEIISTTYEHPFYVKERGFVSAGELVVGNEVLDTKGKVLVVENSSLEVLDGAVKVYNFQVEDFHTYHVGTHGVLVHNANADYNKGADPLVNQGKDALSKSDIDDFTIKNKHLDSSDGGWSKFNVSTEADANALVKDVLNNGKITSVIDNGLGDVGQQSYEIIINAGKVIGTNGQTSLTMIVDDLGNIWTVYPTK